MNYIQLGKRIKDERKKLNLTQAKLAEDINISDAYMGQIERGERSLTLDTLVRLVNRLGVSIDYLLKDYVIETDDNYVNQFRQIINKRQKKQKQLAIDVIKTIFTNLDEDDYY